MNIRGHRVYVAILIACSLLIPLWALTAEQQKSRRANGGMEKLINAKRIWSETQAVHETAERIPGDPLDAQGGPDGYGYRYVDNTGGDTATFNWIELCGDPFAVDGPTGDNGTAIASWGWNFPFYGTPYTSARVSVDGTLVFGTGLLSLVNSCPFATENPTQARIAVYWDDLRAASNTGCTGDGTPPWVRWRDFGSYFVVQWAVGWTDDVDSRLRFQAILYANGRIKMQYDTVAVPGHPNEASIGIDAFGEHYGVEYLSCNVSTLPHGTNNRAVWFYPGPPPPGRCCYTSNGSPLCTNNTLAQCTALNGTWTPGVTCQQTPCPLGRCCYGDPATPQCANTYESYCVALRGNWDGTASCSSGPCPPSCIVCQPGDIAEPMETMGPEHADNDPNGGCGSLFGDNPTYLYGSIECGQTICGRIFTYTDSSGAEFLDNDWYTVTLYDSSILALDVEMAFSGAVALAEFSDCGTININASVLVQACDAGEATTVCLGAPAGTYALVVFPFDQPGEPWSYYRLSLLCVTCGTGCGDPQRLTAYRTPNAGNAINLRWIATQTAGTYKLWSTANPNHDGDPDAGTDPDWTLVTELPAPANAPSTLTAVDSPLEPYRNYVVTHECTGPAINENCQNPVRLTGPLPISVSGSTEGTASDYSALGLGEFPPACWQGDYYDETTTCGGPDVVFDWIVPATGAYNISLCGSAYDSGLLIYQYTCPTEPVNPLNFICGNDDAASGCPNFASEIVGLPLTAGQQILIVVDGWVDSAGPFVLTVSQ